MSFHFFFTLLGRSLLEAVQRGNRLRVSERPSRLPAIYQNLRGPTPVCVCVAGVADMQGPGVVVGGG